MQCERGYDAVREEAEGVRSNAHRCIATKHSLVYDIVQAYGYHMTSPGQNIVVRRALV